MPLFPALKNEQTIQDKSSDSKFGLVLSDYYWLQKLKGLAAKARLLGIAFFVKKHLKSKPERVMYNYDID